MLGKREHMYKWTHIYKVDVPDSQSVTWLSDGLIGRHLSMSMIHLETRTGPLVHVGITEPRSKAGEKR